MNLTWTIDRADGTCACGCLEATARTFRPGHDARLKSKLVRAHILGQSVLVRTLADPAVAPAVVTRTEKFTPEGYGHVVLSAKGFAALYKSMFRRTYRTRYRAN